MSRLFSRLPIAVPLIAAMVLAAAVPAVVALFVSARGFDHILASAAERRAEAIGVAAGDLVNREAARNSMQFQEIADSVQLAGEFSRALTQPPALPILTNWPSSARNSASTAEKRPNGYSSSKRKAKAACRTSWTSALA